MTDDIRVRRVNRYDDWNARSMFGGFEFRVILKHEPSFIEALNRGEKLKERLAAEAGVEDEDWFVCFGTDEDEFYLTNSMFLLSWKMKSPDDYKKWLHRIEHHTVDDEKLEQQVLDDEQNEKEEADRREREQEERIKAAQAAQQNPTNPGGMMSIISGPNMPTPAPSPPKTYTNSDNPADWEFAWILGDSDKNYRYTFFLREINNPSNIEIDYDLTAHLIEDNDYEIDAIYGTGNDRDIVRNYLLGLGFTENPKMLKDLYCWDCYTDQMIAKYYDVINGLSLDSIKGLGWEAWFSYEDEDPVFFLQPINGSNDQFYPFDLGDDWYNDMECHEAYEGGNKQDGIKILKSMGFKYSGDDPNR